MQTKRNKLTDLIHHHPKYRFQVIETFKMSLSEIFEKDTYEN